jgi:hypothetical protein
LEKTALYWIDKAIKIILFVPIFIILLFADYMFYPNQQRYDVVEVLKEWWNQTPQ